jgi:ABC-type bacteriocin/lantibiotic exporter with double-glycine peptidase domain
MPKDLLCKILRDLTNTLILTKYALYDPADDSQVMINSAVAETIKPQAYTFYRPLPSKAIGYKDLLRYLYDGIWKSDLAAVLVMGVLGGLLGAVTPVVTGNIFDRVIPDGEKALLTQIGFLLIAIAITTFAFNLTRSFAMHRIEGRTEADLQAAVWDRLLSLPVPFFKDYTAGELTGRTMGISQIRSVMSGAVSNTMISGIFAIFYFILLFYYSWKLALICLGIVLVVMAVSLTFGYLQIRYERQLIDLNNTLSGKVYGLLMGIGKIKTSGAEKRAFNNWARDFSQVRDVFGLTLKTTYAVVDGEERKVYKDPVTDKSSFKKSQKGLVVVVRDEKGNMTYIDELDRQQQKSYESVDLLEPIFKDGKLLRDESLAEIRERMFSSI